MVEEKVDVEIFAADFEMDLLADEGETGPQLEEELTDVGDEPSLELLLFRLIR